MDEKFLLGNRELAPSSTVVVDQLSPHGRRNSSWEMGDLSLRAARLVSLSPSYPIRRAFDLNKERLVFGATDGVSTTEEGRELVSRAMKLMSRSPSYTIRRAFDLNLTRKGWYSE